MDGIRIFDSYKASKVSDFFLWGKEEFRSFPPIVRIAAGNP